jgi:hypothetical protein
MECAANGLLRAAYAIDVVGRATTPTIPDAHDQRSHAIDRSIGRYAFLATAMRARRGRARAGRRDPPRARARSAHLARYAAGSDGA